MAKKVLTWLEFLAIENRLRALLKMLQAILPETKVTIYSLSDNTLWEHWVEKDSDGVVADGLFEDNDLLFSSEIRLKGIIFEENYVRLEIFSNGEIGCRAFLGFEDEQLTTSSVKLLNEVCERENMVPLDDHRDLFFTVREVFHVLREVKYNPSHKFHGEFNEDFTEAVKKYLIGKKEH
jgi:hypothetical protein